MSRETQTWEYLTAAADPAPDLAALGREGWELVATAGDPRGTLYFRRPGLSFRERVTMEQRRHVYEQAGRTPLQGLPSNDGARE